MTSCSLITSSEVFLYRPIRVGRNRIGAATSNIEAAARFLTCHLAQGTVLLSPFSRQISVAIVTLNRVIDIARHAIRRRRSESGIYHIMPRGINRQQIFADEGDCQRFLDTLEKCKGLSIRQISRLTGISKKIVERSIRNNGTTEPSPCPPGCKAISCESIVLAIRRFCIFGCIWMLLLI